MYTFSLIIDLLTCRATPMYSLKQFYTFELWPPLNFHKIYFHLKFIHSYDKFTLQKTCMEDWECGLRSLPHKQNVYWQLNLLSRWPPMSFLFDFSILTIGNNFYHSFDITLCTSGKRKHVTLLSTEDSIDIGDTHYLCCWCFLFLVITTYKERAKCILCYFFYCCYIKVLEITYNWWYYFYRQACMLNYWLYNVSLY